MASQTTKLTVLPRDPETSRAARRLRREGQVPGVLYGGGGEPLAVRGRRARAAPRARGAGAVVELEVDGATTPAVLKDAQRHPVRGATLHVDFLRVRLDVADPGDGRALELVGAEEAPGVKEGGVLEHVTREVNIEALPTDIPERLELDVSGMQVNDTRTLSAVTAPSASRSSTTSRRPSSRRSPAEARGRGRGGGARARRPSSSARGPPRRARRRGEGGERRRTPPTRLESAAHAARLSGGLARRSTGSSSAWATPDRATRARRHNVGFAVAEELARRWDLPRPSRSYGGLLTEGRAGPGGPRVALLRPQTYMNEAGRSGRARRAGRSRVDLDRVLVVHDEIDLPVRRDPHARSAAGSPGTTASSRCAAGSARPTSRRVRVGVGRPDSTDPDIVAAYVLGRWRAARGRGRELVARAADAAERIVATGAVA